MDEFVLFFGDNIINNSIFNFLTQIFLFEKIIKKIAESPPSHLLKSAYFYSLFNNILDCKWHKNISGNMWFQSEFEKNLFLP